MVLLHPSKHNLIGDQTKLVQPLLSLGLILSLRNYTALVNSIHESKHRAGKPTWVENLLVEDRDMVETPGGEY